MTCDLRTEWPEGSNHVQNIGQELSRERGQKCQGPEAQWVFKAQQGGQNAQKWRGSQLRPIYQVWSGLWHGGILALFLGNLKKHSWLLELRKVIYYNKYYMNPSPVKSNHIITTPPPWKIIHFIILFGCRFVLIGLHHLQLADYILVITTF